MGFAVMEEIVPGGAAGLQNRQGSPCGPWWVRLPLSSALSTSRRKQVCHRTSVAIRASVSPAAASVCADGTYSVPWQDSRRPLVRYPLRHVGPAPGESVAIGATSFGLFLSGELIAFTAKPQGAEVGLGRGIGTLECSKTVLAVHSPISLRLEETNEAAEEHPRIINQDPYGAGWMVRGRLWPGRRKRRPGRFP